MIKVVTHPVLVLALACLFVLSAALPTVLVLNRTVSVAQSTPSAHVPGTLLGKLYRTRRDAQLEEHGCRQPPSRSTTWPLGVAAHHNDSGLDSGANPLPNGDGASIHQTQARATMGDRDGTDSETALDTKRGAWYPLPLVLNTSPGYGLALARSRLVKLRRPAKYSACSDSTPPSSQARSDGMNQGNDEEQHIQPLDSPGRESKTGSRQVSVQVGRLTRLYERGEWKSRFSQEHQ